MQSLFQRRWRIRAVQEAIAGNQVYDADIEAGIKADKPVSEIYESLIFKDIRDTCDRFKEIYEQTGGLDGYVSIEVDPHLARDTEGTVEEAIRYYRAIERENVMIKIPGTPEGFPAIERVIAEGINVNVTLLFSVESYEQTAWAYIRGLETRVLKDTALSEGVSFRAHIKQDKPIDKIASVASFFLSRIDVKIDDRIDERLKNIGTETLNEEVRLRQVKGKVAIANAKLAYQKFREITQSDRWQALADKGANIQRLLWASTSTKVQLENLNSSTAKRFKTAFGATPQFEHLYIDPDFRIVKTRREAKQRPSYTIAIRRN